MTAGRPIKTHTKLGQVASSSGLHLYEISGQAKIAYSTLRDYVDGKKPISHKHLINLCELFDCDPDELIGLNENAHHN